MSPVAVIVFCLLAAGGLAGYMLHSWRRREQVPVSSQEDLAAASRALRLERDAYLDWLRAKETELLSRMGQDAGAADLVPAGEDYGSWVDV